MEWLQQMIQNVTHKGAKIKCKEVQSIKQGFSKENLTKLNGGIIIVHVIMRCAKSLSNAT